MVRTYSCMHISVKGVVRFQHMCMMIRGVEKQHSSTITNVMLGAFREDNATRAEFMNSL